MTRMNEAGFGNHSQSLTGVVYISTVSISIECTSIKLVYFVYVNNIVNRLLHYGLIYLESVSFFKTVPSPQSSHLSWEARNTRATLITLCESTNIFSLY